MKRNPKLPRHLRFLEDHLLAGDSRGLEYYYPETARGELTPHASDGLFEAGGITYVGPNDGSMVPITAEGLEPMQENIWDPGKLSALVEAITAGDDPHVHPGYAQIWLDGGELHAQVRDGNHRTFAPVAAGSEFSWVILSDHTRQDIDERLPGTDKLYRAIRAAQRHHGAPQLKRRRHGRVKAGKREALLKAEREYAALNEATEQHYRNLLKTHGPARSGFSLEEQLERPQVFWRSRAPELREERGDRWYRENIQKTPEGRAQAKRWDQRSELWQKLSDMREAAGLLHRERLDPKTGEVVRENPTTAALKRKLMR